MCIAGSGNNDPSNLADSAYFDLSSAIRTWDATIAQVRCTGELYDAAIDPTLWEPDCWRECIAMKEPAGLLELAKLIADLATKVRQGKEGAGDELGEEVASALKERRLKGKGGDG